MALIEWKDDLSVNIRMIDGQHKELIRMINELNEAMKVGKGQEVIGKVLTGLIDYTRMHFATEERLFETHKYPGYIAHKGEHDKLTAQVLDLKKKFDNRQAVITVEIMSFLKDWLQKHIMKTDKQYSSYLNNKGVM
ncbi:MAG: bacteriohemerythrin [Nitrospiraceae bacterium]|nr:bacteriohemerythrin [Nitrospiraceae bacterium]